MNEGRGETPGFPRCHRPRKAQNAMPCNVNIHVHCWPEPKNTPPRGHSHHQVAQCHGPAPRCANTSAGFWLRFRPHRFNCHEQNQTTTGKNRQAPSSARRRRIGVPAAVTRRPRNCNPSCWPRHQGRFERRHSAGACVLERQAQADWINDHVACNHYLHYTGSASQKK